MTIYKKMSPGGEVGGCHNLRSVALEKLLLVFFQGKFHAGASLHIDRKSPPPGGDIGSLVSKD